MNNKIKTSDKLVATIMGDPQSAKWAEFVEVFTPILRNFSKRQFQDLDADDLIQETFRALIEKMPNYRYDPEADSLFRYIFRQSEIEDNAYEGYRYRNAFGTHIIGPILVKNPGLLLCDEPTGALDYETSKEILALIEQVNKTYGCTVIIVTHNDAIGGMAHRILRLRDGVIAEDVRNQNVVAARDLEW